MFTLIMLGISFLLIIIAAILQSNVCIESTIEKWKEAGLYKE